VDLGTAVKMPSPHPGFYIKLVIAQYKVRFNARIWHSAVGHSTTVQLQ